MHIKVFRVFTETHVHILNDVGVSDSSPSVLPNTEFFEVLESYIFLGWVQVRKLLRQSCSASFVLERLPLWFDLELNMKY